MTRSLEVQILVYMSIISFLTFAWGYSKGHRDGLQVGVIRGRALARATRWSDDANR